LRLWVVAVVVTLSAVLVAGCGGEESEPEEKGAAPASQDTTVEQAVGSTEQTEATDTTVDAVSETTEEANASQERPPEDVLALQYEYINRGDFDNAYSLFAEQSRQEVSLEQYRAFFEANAPYSLSDYSFSSTQTQGDSATVDATFTANSAAGAEQLERTQRFARENGEWRVVIRPEQIAAFTATNNPASPVPVEEEASPAEEQAGAAEKGTSKAESGQKGKAPSEARAAREAAASEIVLRISGTAGVPYRGSFGGIASSRSGRQDVEGTIGQGQNEYRLSDIMGDVQVRQISAPISKAGPNVEGDLRVQILYQGEVVEENLATGTAGIAPVSWSPGRPF
jgi:hypothetical protein